MAESFDVHNVVFPLGTIAASAAGSACLMPVPKQGGGITIINAFVNGIGIGTVNGLRLVTFTPLVASGLGTPAVSGTIGTTTAAAGTLGSAVPIGIPISSGFVDPGTTGAWVGVLYASGTIVYDGAVSLSYIMGK